jgi:glycosyltransferase involved in cell wall biosynthesis
VRRQDFEEWEIIVSDNCSEENIAGYIQELNEPRIRYFRTGNFIPVTENWNNALEMSTGDYVIMLGDDDCIMQGFFRTVRKMVEQYAPDFIYTNAFQYSYPGVMPTHPRGFLQSYGYSRIFAHATEPYVLDGQQAHKMVRESMDFRTPFTFNMQHSIVSRKFISEMLHKGPFFQSPYPDFYATNVMFLMAQRILVCPYPLVTIGVSPKSFGYFYFNKDEKTGTDFLKNLPDQAYVIKLKKVLLPGTDINTSWLFAMETIKANYGSQFDLSVNYRRYRFLQIVHEIKKYCRRPVVLGIDKKEARTDLNQLWVLLSWWEKLYSIAVICCYKVVDVIPERQRLKITNKVMDIIGQFPKGTATRVDRDYKNILEVFEQVNPMEPG